MKRGVRVSFVWIILLFFLCLTSFSSVSAEDIQPLNYVFDSVAPIKLFDRLGESGASLFMGLMTYSYGIEVPGGVNGVKPEISLFYSSYRAEQRPTALGKGWDLNQNYVMRNTNYTFEDSTDDEFRLVFGGNYYDLVYSQLENRFYTKTNNFMYIKNISNGNNTLGEYWVLTTKEGNHYRFGFNNDSEMVSNTYDYSWKWNLDMVNDTHDNKIYYSYMENPFSEDYGASYLEKIVYNNDLEREIKFTYGVEPREDLWNGYEEGNQIKESRRLKEIYVLTGGNLVGRMKPNFGIKKWERILKEKK